MRVAYIVNNFPIYSQTFILNEIVELEKKGVEVSTFSFSRKNQAVVHRKVAEVRTVRWFTKPNLLQVVSAQLYWFCKNPRRYCAAAWVAWLGGRKTIRVLLRCAHDIRAIAETRPDHLHAHFGGRTADVAMIAHVLLGVRFTFTSHGADVFHRPPANYRMKSHLATKHVAISEYNRQYLVDRFEIRHSDMAVIRCGVNVNFFDARQPLHQEQRILSVARLVWEKGLDNLIAACAILKSRAVPFETVIVGDGPEMPLLIEMIDQLGLRDDVLLVGAKDQEEVRDYLHAATVKVLPSRSEGLPVALMEAMAARVPVISSQITGIPELVEDGVSGYLVPPGDVEQLADRIETLLNNESMRRRFTTNAFAKVQQDFNLTVETDKLLRLWQGTIREECPRTACPHSVAPHMASSGGDR